LILQTIPVLFFSSFGDGVRCPVIYIYGFVSRFGAFIHYLCMSAQKSAVRCCRIRQATTFFAYRLIIAQFHCIGKNFQCKIYESFLKICAAPSLDK